MRKIFSLLLTFMLTIFMIPAISAREISLEDVKDAFNDNTVMAQYKEYGIEMSAIIDDTNPNHLTITLKMGDDNSVANYELDGNILSSTDLNDDNSLTAYFLADSIGYLHGYEYGNVLDNFNMFEEEVSNYTVGEEGFEFSDDEDNYYAKLDITKQIPLIDDSEFYLKPEEFDMIAEIVANESSGNQTGIKSKLAYNAEVREDENYITIGEKGGLTDSAYNSILSIIEVMYGEEAVEYFKEEYPEYYEGYAQREGFTVDYDAEIDTDEEPIFTDTQVIRVTFDNEYMKDAFLRTEYIGEEVKREDKTITLDFTENESYKLNMFDSASSSDVAFLYKYILEPVFIDGEGELEDDETTAYFNIVNGKVVVGTKADSLFKLVIDDEEFTIEIMPTKESKTEEKVTANHKDIKAKEYDECEYVDHEHYRYGVYNNVEINVIYGGVTNPNTSDNIIFYVSILIISVIGITGILIYTKKKLFN